MKKLKFVPILLIISIHIFSVVVNAFGIVKEDFEAFIDYLNNGDENIYTYIDSSNAELINYINLYKNRVEVSCKILNISYLGNSEANIICNMVTVVDSKNIIRGEVYFDFKEIDDTFIIYNTNLFDLINKPSIPEFKEESPQKSFSNFINYLSNGDNRVYSYIDNSNIELATNIDKYIDKIEITYTNFEIEKSGNDKYIIECEIDAEGEGWSTSGFKTEYYLKKQDNRYIVYETTLFDVVGVENMAKFITSIFILIGIFSFLFPFIIILIIFNRIKRIKKKTDNNLNDINIEENIDIYLERDNSPQNDNPIQYK